MLLTDVLSAILCLPDGCGRSYLVQLLLLEVGSINLGKNLLNVLWTGLLRLFFSHKLDGSVIGVRRQGGPPDNSHTVPILAILLFSRTFLVIVELEANFRYASVVALGHPLGLRGISWVHFL